MSSAGNQGNFAVDLTRIIHSILPAMKKSKMRVELLLFLIFASVITAMILVKVFIIK